MSDDDLYEMRLYVSRPAMSGVLHDQWEADFYDIYAKYHTMLGGFDSLREVPDEATGEDSDGVVLFMRHPDRAFVDRATDALVAGNLMNEVDGPPGPTVVAGWDRTFLYPVVAPDDEPPAPVAGAVYELRTYLTGDPEPLLDSVDAWYPAHAMGLFVSHPESSDMPVGVALLLRHHDLATATAHGAADALADLRAAAGPAAEGVRDCTRRLLRPLSISALA